MKNFLLGASLIAFGVWYFQHAAHYSRPPEPQQQQEQGEIVVAKAPDGSLQQRWPGATPTATRSR